MRHRSLRCSSWTTNISRSDSECTSFTGLESLKRFLHLQNLPGAFDWCLQIFLAMLGLEFIGTKPRGIGAFVAHPGL